MATERDLKFMRIAIDEARQGRAEGGIPIGACLVSGGGELLGRGHNRMVQQKSVLLHGEMDCLERAGKLDADVYRHATLYTTLSPCDMCAGAIVHYKIPRVVMGEDKTDYAAQEYLRQRGVEVVNLDLEECHEMMNQFRKECPHLWRDDALKKAVG